MSKRGYVRPHSSDCCRDGRKVACQGEKQSKPAAGQGRVSERGAVSHLPGWMVLARQGGILSRASDCKAV